MVQTIDDYTYRTFDCPGRIYIARGLLALWEFLQHLPANIGKDQKKSYHLGARPLTLCHVLKSALIIVLRS